jgi:hypothetical protein
MADLFKEVIPSILKTKKNVLQDEFDVKEYKKQAFMVNRALAYHMDCVLYANEMNLHSDLDGDMQYSYLLNTIRSMKRDYQPWQKTSTDKDIECVKKYFGYSNERAKEALRILNDEQIADIRTKTEKGGVTK